MCSQWNKRCANNTRRNIESNSIAGTRISCLGARESRQEIERDFNTLGLRCWRVPTRELATPSAVWDRHIYIYSYLAGGRYRFWSRCAYIRENLFQKTLTHSAHREKRHFLNTKFHTFAVKHTDQMFSGPEKGWAAPLRLRTKGVGRWETFAHYVGRSRITYWAFSRCELAI